ncbi:hypothetical protein D3C72_2072080 [compost metagenome]
MDLGAAGVPADCGGVSTSPEFTSTSSFISPAGRSESLTSYTALPCASRSNSAFTTREP